MVADSVGTPPSGRSNGPFGGPRRKLRWRTEMGSAGSEGMATAESGAETPNMAWARRVTLLATLCLISLDTVSANSAGVVQEMSAGGLYTGSEPKFAPEDNPATSLAIDSCHPSATKMGISCSREGFFISGFQGTVYWKTDDMFEQEKYPVPEAKAICCNASLPTAAQLPPAAKAILPLDAVPEAIISVGCHRSRSMECEEGSVGDRSLVAAFVDADHPEYKPNKYYPVNPPVCCTPVLLMSNGQAWELFRCDCISSMEDIQCGEKTTDRFLLGYHGWQSEGQIIPFAPTRCCKLCIGAAPYNMSQCTDMNHCSGKGVCIAGTCMCRSGWAGADCSESSGHNAGSDQWWQSFWWLGVIGFMCAFTGLFATFWMIQRAEWADRSPHRHDHDESLLHWVDMEGSAGGEDSSYTSASSASRRSVTTISVASLEVASVEDAGQQADEQGLPEHTVRRPGPRTNQEQGDQEPARASQEIEVEEAPEQEDLQKTGDDLTEEEGLMKTLPFNSESSPLNTVMCSVCMMRPVQVALVPCGHSNLCRRCSRKLQRCPFCRKEIARRQKLFLSG
ncbi:unnamed protein product [Ostreobium quekettii]|uniref:RING-type domain-containing protein n=1 Tax=Ostreobium quekettii TaxID=121088 RepID=A0A8S1IWD2_9CHLO|nr:unnamed protein product [Ostreobium quekettii]